MDSITQQPTTHTPNLDYLKRAAYMLKVVQRFIEDNPVSDYTIFYDGAKCDGACLAEDCGIAESQLLNAIARAEGRQ